MQTYNKKAVDWFSNELSLYHRNKVAAKHFPEILKSLNDEQIEICYLAEHPEQSTPAPVSDSLEVFPDIFNPDGLFAQMGLITKAGAYDIVSKQVQELQAENAALKLKVYEIKREVESIRRNNEKINQYTWATYKEQVDLHIKEIKLITKG